MKNKTFFKYPGCPSLILLFILVLFVSFSVQLHENNFQSHWFGNARITLDKQSRCATEIKFNSGNNLPEKQFFEMYKQAFHLSDENDARDCQIFTDKLGKTHHRMKQYYKGIELAEVQYLLHEQDGLVFHAHGNFISGLNLDVSPALSEKKALQCVLNYVNAESYMWENPKNEAFLKKEQNDPKATYYPKGELKISAGQNEMIA